MFEYTPTELSLIDKQLDPILNRAKERSIEMEQLALDSTRLLSCTSNRLEEYKDKGFFKRCWSSLTGKTGALERANQADLIQMQKIAWRYLQLLNERDLMLAHSMITLKNNLVTLQIKEDETRKAITLMANIIWDRFESLEDRVDQLEVDSKIHSWLLTLSTRDYDDRFPPHIRLLKIVYEFYSIKSGDWSQKEIMYLRKAVEEVKLNGKQNLSLETFINGLIDEIGDKIGQVPFDTFAQLVRLPVIGGTKYMPVDYIIDNIAVPSFTALYRIHEDYKSSASTIDALDGKLNIVRTEALKHVLMTFVNQEGIDITAVVPLRDFTVELLTCRGLAISLHQSPQVAENLPWEKTKEMIVNHCDQMKDDICKNYNVTLALCHAKELYSLITHLDAHQLNNVGYVFVRANLLEEALECFEAATTQYLNESREKADLGFQSLITYNKAVCQILMSNKCSSNRERLESYLIGNKTFKDAMRQYSATEMECSMGAVLVLRRASKSTKWTVDTMFDCDLCEGMKASAESTSGYVRTIS